MPISRRVFSASAAAGLANRLALSNLWALRPRPRLLVWLVAEQFRSDYLDRAEKALPSGGFRRLMEDGAFFPDCRFRSTTFTTSGLATLSTGAYPETHGIVADSWYDREQKKAALATLEAFEATTLADQVAADGRGRVFVAGLDPTRAWFLAGRTPTQVFSMDLQGKFVAERNRPETDAWLPGFQNSHLAEKWQNAPWTALGANPGAPPLRLLRYDASRPAEFYALYKASPFAQGTQFDLVRELLLREKLGQGDTTDFLAIGLGSISLLGYEVGADSPLMLQMVLQLDRQIQSTLEVLNKVVGTGNYALVFTAAHGAPAEPNPERRSKLAVAGENVARAINRELSNRYDVSKVKNAYIERYLYPFLYLRTEQLRRYDIPPREARAAAGRAALRASGVAGYYTADGESSHEGDWRKRFQNSFHAVRSGDLMLAYLPEHVEEYGAGRGISYGSLYNYDARVPLLFYGPQFQAQIFESTVEAVDVAPTLARVMGTAMPSSSTGHVLGEAFAPLPKERK
jgi:predicted AlkP superfamily pyrophosphatase or phosphodiesterase